MGSWLAVAPASAGRRRPDQFIGAETRQIVEAIEDGSGGL